jgi:hypothetical protein
MLLRTEAEFLQSFEPDIGGIFIYGNPQIPPPFPALCLQNLIPILKNTEKKEKQNCITKEYNIYTVLTDAKSLMKVIIPIYMMQY